MTWNSFNDENIATQFSTKQKQSTERSIPLPLRPAPLLSSLWSDHEKTTKPATTTTAKYEFKRQKKSAEYPFATKQLNKNIFIKNYEATITVWYGHLQVCTYRHNSVARVPWRCFFSSSMLFFSAIGFDRRVLGDRRSYCFPLLAGARRGEADAFEQSAQTPSKFTKKL